MTHGIDQAIAKLRRDPGKPVLTEIDGLVIELHYKGQRSAGDVFREIGPWEGETTEELIELLRQARKEGGSKEPPAF